MSPIQAVLVYKNKSRPIVTYCYNINFTCLRHFRDVLYLIRGHEKSADTDSVGDGLGVRTLSIVQAMRFLHASYDLTAT